MVEHESRVRAPEQFARMQAISARSLNARGSTICEHSVRTVAAARTAALFALVHIDRR